MDHEANPYSDPSEPVNPSPAASPQRWRVPRAALTVGLASFLALAGAGAAFAVGGSGGSSSSSSSSGSSSSSNPSTNAPAVPGRGFHGGPHGFGPMGGMGPGVVHGTFTVRNGTGFKTMEMQVGTVQSVSTTSLVVLSADNVSETYTVQPSTVVNSQSAGISTVKKGDTVRVEAVQSSGGFTATDIMDTTQIQSSRQGFGFTPPAAPAPSASTSGALQ